jgi:hypothetical protein
LNFPLSNNPAATDYMDRYQGEVAKNNELTERVAALEGQIAAMQGRERGSHSSASNSLMRLPARAIGACISSRQL